MGGIIRGKVISTLVILLILGMVLGTLHNRSLSSGRSFFAQDIVRTVLAPVNMASRGLLSLGNSFMRLGRPRKSLLKENAMLRKETRRLIRENSKLHEAAEENVRLRNALELKKLVSIEMLSSEVISRKESNWFDTATIDRGRNAGIKEGSAVVTYRGLVGQVVEVGPYTSQIVSLSNLNSAVSAMDQRSRCCGILQGQGSDYLILTYLPKDADVKVSDIVVSSGMGGMIPKGFVVGRIVKVVRNKTEGTTSALIKPSVRFDQIEQVFVLKPGSGE